MIFYFSATGNCKYVSARIAENLGDTLISIADSYKSGTNSFAVNEKESIGIVSPTYALGLPSIVADFLKSLKLQMAQKPYIYFLATYGTTPAHTGLFANKYFNEQTGISFDAYYSVKMPDTWTPIFDVSDANKIFGINKKAELQIDEVIVKIQQKLKGDFMKNKLPQFTKFFYLAYYEKMRKTKNFVLEDTCIACGLCAKKCPVNAIEMKGGRPVWIKDKCAMCLGCLHRCPKFAIQYGSKTKKHGQYINPHVSI